MYRLNESLIVENVDGNTFVIDSERQKLYRLGSNESHILKLCLESTKEELICKIMHEYNGEDIEQNVVDYLSKLKELGIIIEE